MGVMAMNLRIPDKADHQLTERAAREKRSKHDLVLEAIDQANERAELTIDDVLAELAVTQAETLRRLA